MAHKLSFACAEMILSYHLLPHQIFFTHKLEPVTSLFCGCVFVCVLCGLFLFGLASGLLCFGPCFLQRAKGIGLCTGPLPVYFCGHYSFGPCVN